ERAGERSELATDPIDVQIDRGLCVRIAAVLKRSHVARDARYAKQSRLLIDQFLDRPSVHLELVDQIEDDAGIEIAATGSHWQTVGRGESHRARHALPVGHRAHARPVAEM